MIFNKLEKVQRHKSKQNKTPRDSKVSTSMELPPSKGSDKQENSE